MSQNIQVFIDPKKLQTRAKYQKLVPRMNAEDQYAFLSSIKTHGIRESIIVNDDNIVLDGHSRLKIAQDLKLKLVPYQTRTFSDPLEEEKYVIETNLERRHLTPFQKIELAVPLMAVQQRIAKQKQREEGKKHGRGKKKSLTSKEAKDQHLENKSSSIIAKQVGISKSTLERGLKVLQDNDPKLKEKLRNNEIKITTAYTEVIAKEQAKIKTPPLPKGKYNVLEIDFPWSYRQKNVGGTGHGSARSQYPTLTMSDIIHTEIPKIKKLIADDAVCFLWVTTPLLADIFAADILNKLGFTYKTMITWHKQVSTPGLLGMGFWYRGETEHILLGVKGKVKAFASQQSNFIESKTGKHSEKPDELRELIEQSTQNVKNRKLISLYARKKIKNWTVYGNEI